MFARLADLLRNAARYRDELAIVVIGLAWQGAAGATMPHHAPHRDEVVVRVRTAAVAQRIETRRFEVVKVAPVAPIAPVAPVTPITPVVPLVRIAPVAPVAPVVPMTAVQGIDPVVVHVPVVPHATRQEAERVRQAIVRAMAIEQAVRSGHAAATVEAMVEGMSTIN